jgi:hypothetical protein
MTYLPFTGKIVNTDTTLLYIEYPEFINHKYLCYYCPGSMVLGATRAANPLSQRKAAGVGSIPTTALQKKIHYWRCDRNALTSSSDHSKGVNIRGRGGLCSIDLDGFVLLRAADEQSDGGPDRNAHRPYGDPQYHRHELVQRGPVPRGW